MKFSAREGGAFIAFCERETESNWTSGLAGFGKQTRRGALRCRNIRFWSPAVRAASTTAGS